MVKSPLVHLKSIGLLPRELPLSFASGVHLYNLVQNSFFTLKIAFILPRFD